MAPDIEWQIGEEEAQEVIARVKDKPPRRRPGWLVGVVIGLGVVLGAAYTAIPEPAAPPSPTAVPTATLIPLPPLAEAVEREARALSSGDMQAFLTLLDPALPAWRQEMITSYEVWGSPPRTEWLVRIIDSGRYGPNLGWADVLQFRQGQYFREMRFYRFYRERWVRTPPDLSTAFWGELVTRQTPHFEATYRERDEAAVAFLLSQLEAEVEHACRQFGCEDSEAATHQTRLVLVPGLDSASRRNRTGQAVTVTLPAPSLTGLYYADRQAREPGHNGLIEDTFSAHLLYTLLYAASGGSERWSTDRDGSMFVQAVGNWERVRRGYAPADSVIYRPQLLVEENPFRLERLWSWTPASQQERELMWAQATAVVKFIDDEYGPEMVYTFFRALRQAQSVRQLVEGAGLTFADFQSKWNAWLRNYQASQMRTSLTP